MSRNFLKELEDLANPAPLRDDDDQEDDATGAKVVEKTLLDDEEEDSSPAQSRISRRGVILAEEDARYSGAVVSRSMLDEDELEDDDQGQDDAEDEQDEEMDDEGEESAEDEEVEEEEDDDDDEEDVIEINEDVQVKESDNDSTGLMKIFSNVDVQDEVEKAKAVQAQIKLWEQLLGARIRFQRVLAMINRLPQAEDEWQRLWSAVLESDSAKVRAEYEECRRSLKSTLDKLVDMRDYIVKRGGFLVGAASSTSKIDNDEEILSSPDEADEPETTNGLKRKSRKRKLIDLDDYSKHLEEQYVALKPYRDQTILKWFEKTRLATGRFARSSFNAFENNPLQQIEHILLDRDRLIKRTQLKRSSYTIWGKQPENNNGVDSTEADQEYDPEIFDDDDFYQQLLRELIERRTVGVTDPVALSRQWLELQKLKSKSKKKLVDRRASKGRRCRYDVMPKLVNFMAPMDHCPMSDEAREELFGSLFKDGS